jgi:hypothetical protein
LNTIIWDVDDVLNDMMRTWFESAWLPRHPGCGLAYDQITENPPHGLLGATLQEYLASLDAFRLSPEAKEMPPLRETLDWFQVHGARFRHMALTAVPIPASPVSAAWVMRHFGRWIRSFHVVPSTRHHETSPAYDASKGDFLRWLGKGDVLVDDSVQNVEEAKALGFRVVLMPRPWNGSLSTIREALDSLNSLGT